MPNTLKEALICFALTNAIRDLRGDKTSHRSMLINISRYIAMHGVIEEYVNDYFEKIKSAFFNYGKMNSSNEIIDFAKELFDREYCHCNQQWKAVKENLYESNKDVKLLSVNTSNTMVNYKEYEETGARFIFIGGLSLSRGLTLEGLCVSYFYRYSKTYDVLFQMGRWFGYRVGYEDLFRIYMPKELIGWYSTITEAVEELKRDLIRMRESGKKPIDFGIRIQNDSSTLKITSSNKMRSAVSAYKTVIGFGEVIPTPDIINDVVVNKNNISIVSNELKNLVDNGFKIENDLASQNKCIKNVPFESIIDIISNVNISAANDLFEKGSIKVFLDTYKDTYFKKWDIVFIEGNKKINSNIFTFTDLNLNIHLTKKSFDSENGYLRMQGAREQLQNPPDTSACLSLEVKNKIISDFEKIYKKTHSSETWKTTLVPATQFLLEKDRNPLLMLYFIELSCDDEDANLLKIKNKFESNKIPPFGMALGIPRYEDTLTEKTLYKINLVEQRKQREKEYNYHLTDDDYEEEIA